MDLKKVVNMQVRACVRRTNGAGPTLVRSKRPCGALVLVWGLSFRNAREPSVSCGPCPKGSARLAETTPSAHFGMTLCCGAVPHCAAQAEDGSENLKAVKAIFEARYRDQTAGKSQKNKDGAKYFFKKLRF